LGSDDVNRLRTRLGRASPLIGVLIIVLIFALLCLGLYFGDRYAHRRAEQRIARALQPPMGTPALPQVDIDGFPFLTQVASGSVDTMHVVADQLGVTSNAPVTLVRADLAMTDVVTNDWFKTMKITHAEGTSLMDYAKLSSLAGAPLSYGSEGRLELVAQTRVFGRDVDAVITGSPRLNAKEQTMTLSDAKISVAGVNLPDFTAQALLAALLRPISLRGIPLGLTASRVSAAEDGVHLDLVGDNLAIAS
jgi:LmeA-like phospholipid-binding